MTARLLTTSTTLTTKNYITNRGSDEQRLPTKTLSEGPLGPEAVASTSGVGQTAFGSVIPPEWGYVKLDLFDNTPLDQLALGRRRLKLALGVMRSQDQVWMYFRASLNGPWRNVKRGLDFSDPEDLAHYALLSRQRDEFVAMGLEPRVSKFYQRGQTVKGETARGLSCVVAELPGDSEYLTCLVYDQQVIYRRLAGDGLTDRQRGAGVIATSYSQRQRSVRARDLFR